MAKKKIEEVVESPPTSVKTSYIHPLTIDLGREDLNNVVVKINELIECLNRYEIR